MFIQFGASVVLWSLCWGFRGNGGEMMMCERDTLKAAKYATTSVGARRLLLADRSINKGECDEALSDHGAVLSDDCGERICTDQRR
jgi:hypothetical protein